MINRDPPSLTNYNTLIYFNLGPDTWLNYPTNGEEAIAEIDQNNNIYELHNDHLGTPRYITAGNAMANVARGQIAGQQAFGPYGEEMVGTFNGQKLPDGYKPLTGYTGHLNEDMTGLIYMKGRYYSPLWHRFINSDQGVDPNSINQFAYVGGRPFMATDPSGMRHCITYYITIEEPGRSAGEFVFRAVDLYTICFDEGGGGVEFLDRPGGGGGGGDDGGGGGPSGGQNAQPRQVTKEDCNSIRKILAKEKRWGNWIAANYALHNYAIGYNTTNNIGNNYSKMIPTSMGPIDLDWYATLSAWGPLVYPGRSISNPLGKFISGHSIYIGAKMLWEGVEAIIRSEGPYRFEGPYSDPGERVAANAYATGAIFADLFNQAWLDKYCGGK